MDPQQAWNDLLDAWGRHDWEAVDEFADALLAWLGVGGFPPKVIDSKHLGPDFNAMVATEACFFARLRAANVLADPYQIPRDVPFTLTCCRCNNEGPSSDELARTVGWSSIQYVPASVSENFLGICPVCR